MTHFDTLPTLIGLHSPSWLNELQEQIELMREKWPNVHIFALIDCAFVEQTAYAIQQHGLPFRSLFDLPGSASQELRSVSPTLLQLTTETAPAWREVLHLTDGWPMLSIIVTPESLDALALRLSPWCIVNADDQPFVFRFPDTRRLPGIVDVLTPRQHGELFGPAYAWMYRTRSAQWAELPLPQTGHPLASDVVLDEKQCAQLIGESEADQILAMLNTQESALIQQHHPATVYALIAQALKRADHYGIADADRVHWCTLHLEKPGLEQNHAAISLLSALVDKTCAYQDIRNDLARLAQTGNPSRK